MTDKLDAAAVARAARPARSHRWMRWVVIAVGLAGLLQAAEAIGDIYGTIGAWFGPATLPECDSEGVQATLKDIVHQHSSAVVTALSDFATTSRDQLGAACSVRMALMNGSALYVSYTLKIEGRKPMVRITQVRQ